MVRRHVVAAVALVAAPLALVAVAAGGGAPAAEAITTVASPAPDSALIKALGVYAGSAAPDGAAAFDSTIGASTGNATDFLNGSSWSSIDDASTYPLPEWQGDAQNPAAYQVLPPAGGGSAGHAPIASWYQGSSTPWATTALALAPATGVIIGEVQDVTVNRSTAAETSQVFTLQNPVGAGDALVLVVGGVGAAAASVTGGGVNWTEGPTLDSSANRQTSEIWYGLGSSGGTSAQTVTLSGPTSNWGGALVELAGVASAGAFDGSATATGSGWSVTSPPLNLTRSGDVVITGSAMGSSPVSLPASPWVSSGSALRMTWGVPMLPDLPAEVQQTTTDVPSTSSGGATFVLPSAVGAGDTLVLSVAGNGSGPGSVSGGGVTWIKGPSEIAAGQTTELWYGQQSLGGEGTESVSLSGPSAEWGGTLYEFSGVGALDTSSDQQGSGSSVTVPALGLASEDDLVVAASGGSGSEVAGPGAPWTAADAPDAGGSGMFGSAFQSVHSAASPSGGWSQEGSGPWATVALAFLPAGSLAAGATGAYDSYFTTVASELVAAGQGSSIIRLGWEFNGDWFPWSVENPSDAANFVQYWRRIVVAMRSVPGSRFVFEWNPTAGWPVYGSPAPDASYPGDVYVGYIGLDLYDTCPGSDAQCASPEGRWNWDETEQGYGLNWLASYAGTSGTNRCGGTTCAAAIPITLPEWGLWPGDGLGGGDNSYFVAEIGQWIATEHVSVATYFDYGAESLGLYPQSTSTLNQLVTTDSLPILAVQTAGAAAGTSPSSGTSWSLPYAVGSGDALVLTVDSRSAGATSVSGGGVSWSKGPSIANGGAGTVQIWYGANSSGGSASEKVTLNGPSDYWGGTLIEFSGVASLLPLGTSGSASGSGGSANAPSLSIGSSHEAAVVASTSGAAEVAGPSGPWVDLPGPVYAGANRAGVAYDGVTPSGTSPHAVWTLQLSAPWAVAGVALEPSGSSLGGLGGLL